MQQIDCNPQFGSGNCSRRCEKNFYFFPSFAIWCESRDTFRCAELRCTMPFCAARIRAGSASAKAEVARLWSPAAIASSTLRIAERMRERRDLLTTVRRAAWRAAFFADFVLAMRVDTRDGDRESGAYRVLTRYRQRREWERSIKGRPPASSDAFGAYRVISGNCGRAVGGRISEQGRCDACPMRVAVDMREQRLYSRYEGLAVE